MNRAERNLLTRHVVTSEVKRLCHPARVLVAWSYRPDLDEVAVYVTQDGRDVGGFTFPSSALRLSLDAFEARHIKRAVALWQRHGTLRY